MIGIVKWFGGIKNDGHINKFGFITVNGFENDVFIHKKNILDADYLSDGELVTLAIGLNKAKGKMEAIEVRKLSNDELYFENINIWGDAQKTQYYEDLPFLQKHNISEQDYLKHLPHSYLEKYSVLRQKLDIDQRLQICISLWNHGQKDIKQELKEIALQILNSPPRYSFQNNFTAYSIGEIPEEVYIDDLDFINHLPVENRIKYWINQYGIKDQDEVLNILKDLVIRNHAIYNFPYEISQDVILWQHMTIDYQMKLLVEHQETIFNSLNVNRVIEVLNKLKWKEMLQWVEQLPKELLIKKEIWEALLPIPQVIIGLQQPKEFNIIDKLDEQGKIFYLFKMAKENIPTEIFNKNSIGHNSLVYAVYLLIQAKSKSDQEKQEYFLHAHNIIQNHMYLTPEVLHKMPDLTPLLPLCSCNVKALYCEGKFWPDKNIGEAGASTNRDFCPRTKSPEIIRSKDNMVGCATIKADLSKDWKEWSLLELIASSNIDSRIKNIINAYDYVPKIAGAFNRLNELRERLKCSYCHEFMEFDYKYARNFFASYGVTVAYCKHKDENEKHDQGVYLSHCWSCKKNY